MKSLKVFAALFFGLLFIISLSVFSQTIEKAKTVTLEKGAQTGAKIEGETQPPPPPEQETTQEQVGNPPAQFNQEKLPQQLQEYKETLENAGRWIWDERLGWVWVPNVPEDWEPFRNGYWNYVSSQGGWTWFPDEPFGYVTHHFGRWHWRLGLNWYWMPGTIWSSAWVDWWYYDGYYLGWYPRGCYGYRNQYGFRHHGMMVIHRDQLRSRNLSRNYLAANNVQTLGNPISRTDWAQSKPNASPSRAIRPGNASARNSLSPTRFYPSSNRITQPASRANQSRVSRTAFDFTQEGIYKRNPNFRTPQYSTNFLSRMRQARTAAPSSQPRSTISSRSSASPRSSVFSRSYFAPSRSTSAPSRSSASRSASSSRGGIRRK